MRAALKEELLQLPMAELERLARRAAWRETARPEQLTPRGQWTTWAIVTGRGWGKTRTGAEWTWWEASKEPGSINGVIAPTFDMLRDICFNGESGLLACIPASQIEDYNKSAQSIKLINGAEIQGLSAQEPDRIRGRQFHRVWMDEVASWQYVQEALDNINFCLRLGNYPRRLITTTPKPLKPVRDILNGANTHITSGSTYDNKKNLPASFFADIEKYAETKIGEQEIEGKLLDWSESGIFRRSWFRIWPNLKPDGSKRPFPKLHFIILSYDTAFKLGQANDPSAMSAWGVFYPEEEPQAALMLLDCWSERLSYPDLRAKLKDDYDCLWTDQEKQADIVLIEDKASGQALIPDLQRAGVPVEAYELPANHDKIQRAHAVSHLAKRCIWVPETTDKRFQWKGLRDTDREAPTHIRKWALPFIEQLCLFGPEQFKEMERMRRSNHSISELHDDVTSHDDWVDTFTQCLAWLRDSEWLRLPMDTRSLPELPPPPAHTGVATYG